MSNVLVKNIFVNHGIEKDANIENKINAFLKEINDSKGRKRLIDIKYRSRQLQNSGITFSEALIIYEVD